MIYSLISLIWLFGNLDRIKIRYLINIFCACFNQKGIVHGLVNYPEPVLVSCEHKPCMNGGTCIKSSNNSITATSCLCSSRFTGPSCQYKSMCHSNPCQNGGVCQMSISRQEFKCICPSNQFSGTFCEISPSAECNCLNGGTCFQKRTRQGEKELFCSCPSNYFGRFCQVELRCSDREEDARDGNSILCSFYRSAGFCSFQYAFNFIPVPVLCPRACSLCHRIEPCLDEQSSCPVWSRLGLCDRANRLNPNACRGSCSSCFVKTRNRYFR